MAFVCKRKQNDAIQRILRGVDSGRAIHSIVACSTTSHPVFQEWEEQEKVWRVIVIMKFNWRETEREYT